ncbi:Enhancer of mRNA-decapping protein [Lachnellula hyalina]|uniref:Enhancer of mRNA-decapping protein 3 n=1 Tax=Lachnellula hyalina TaxID=1316788 RepID=A0A8H8QXU7_9HELO|nr:Enhancer of mRNA-decapping protein [Lachnellula hyalina]TVY23344.1 Enhancer of mRNA-decapping protein [Lachnellula hyalina]
MLVTLSSPPGAQLRGIVDSIEAGKSLTLRNVICPANGKYVPEFTINASEIIELVEAVNENAAPPPVVPPPKAKAFEDPAILSVGKRPTPTIGSSSRPSIPSHWQSNAMERTDSARTARDQRALNDITPAATLVTSSVSPVEIGVDIDVAGLNLTELEAEATKEEEEAPSVVKKTRTRRHRQRKKDALIKDGEVTPARETTKSKGWRQTPLLEPNPSFQPFATLRGKKRRDGRMDENGWATEEATDVQDMGDFDFTSNLAKFDKHEVFNQIQAEDSVADEDRLVAHNRLPKAKPGTAGGKNLHHTENVLEVLNGAGKRGELWKSEAGNSDLEDRASQRGSGSGRLSRRAKNDERAESKFSMHRRPVSRKGSSIINVPPSRAHSIPAPGLKPSFYLVPSDRQCEPLSALHMLNLENIADTELGLSEEMMTENAGRGIAEVALSALNAGGGGLTQGKSNTIPTVVILAGNNKSGFRAVAAGRHIRNHGLNVVICVLGLERESELLVGLSRQLKVFRCFGGKVLNKAQLLEYVKNLGAPIELIIDGLLGLTISFEELRTGDQASAYELIEWANRSRAAVLAIDVPTGIEPTNGKVSIIDGRKLYIHAKFVVAMGAPKKGLLEAMARGEGVPDEDGVGNSKGREWQLFVADIGLGAAVWKKTGTRVRRGVEFEGSWVVGMRFQGE